MGLARSPGLHLTTIIHSLEQQVRPRDEWCSSEELQFYGSLGFLWERYFARCFADSIASGTLFRPGEISKDGITGSPDLVDLSNGLVVVETKCSWRSVSKFDFGFENNFWAWIQQISGYAYMLETQIAELHAFFVNGDYKPPMPCTRSIRIEFTEAELKNRWRMLVNHAKDMNWL